MKKKFGLWLNIVTICLCVCAIAIGVYAASTATLTISGQVGFESHGVEMTIDGTLSGYVSETNVDTATQTEEKDLTQVKLTKTSATGAMALGDVYFTDLVLDENDKVPNIVLDLTFTNTSKFKVRATVNALTATGVTITYDKTSLVLDEDDGTDTLKVTFTLEDQENSLTTVNMATVTASTPLVTFTKFTGYEDGEYFIDPDTNMLSVYMGHGTEVDNATDVRLQWQAFAVKGTNLGNSYSITVGSDTWYSLNGVDMTNVDYTGKTFWFIQKYVAAGGYDDAEENWLSGQMFNDSTSDGNDYDTSDIRTYVEGTYLTATGISSTNYYTSAIETRTVNETYTTNYNSTAGTQTCSFTSKLWLINQAELGLLAGKAVTDYGTDVGMTYGVGIQAPCSCCVLGAYWWLRSPDAGDSSCAQFVDDEGDFVSFSVNFDYGVRAAFQIQIAG